MIHQMHINGDADLGSRMSGGKVVVAHCADADGAIHVCNVGDIHDVHIRRLHMHNAAFGDV